MPTRQLAIAILFLTTSMMLFGCKKAEVTTSAADIQETAQQIGDVMASVDESGGSTGSIASMKDTERMQNSVRQSFARFAPGELKENIVAKLFLPEAQAASCAGAGFALCSGRQIVRSFGGCTVGAAVFSGDVTLTWSSGGALCGMGVAGSRIDRVPNFTVTGRRGASLAVSKTGTIGQRIQLVVAAGASSVVNLSNDGINRIFSIGSTILFNQTTATSGDITVTGTSRTSRVMNGGSLNVTNNLTSVVCNYVPTNVTWAGGTCNCPTSGSWSGSCSNGKTTTLDITGCGTANYSEGSDTEAVTFDRCGT